MRIKIEALNLSRRAGLALAGWVAVTLACAGGSAWAGPTSVPGDPVATVNGEPISRAELSQCLIEARGKHMLRELETLEVARQRARERKVAVTRGDIETEELRSLPQDVLDKPVGGERDKAMDAYLANEGLTRVDWRLLMECMAWLRKQVVVPEPTETQLRQLFNRKYGEHVIVRAIQVRTPAQMAHAEERLAREPFELVAKEESQDKDAASHGGLLPEFDRDEPAIPLAVREAAFGLKADGELSDRIDAGDFVFKVKLVKRLPAVACKFEEERKDLTRLLRDRLTSIQVKNELQLLLDGCDIEVVDPALKDQANQEPFSWLAAPPIIALGSANPVVARVNSEPISRATMTDLLIEAHGLNILEWVAQLHVVRQKAREVGVRVLPADVESEQVQWMTKDMLQSDGKARESMLDDYLARKGLTRVDWRLKLECNALLRKMVVVPEPTEQQLRVEFNHTFGEQVKIRMIRVRTQAEMSRVDDRLTRGRSFEEVAQDPALNTQKPSADATLKFSRDDERVPDAVRGVAFALKDEPGSVSGRINAEGFLYKIKFIKLIEPDADKSRFEDERGKLAAQAREGMTRVQMNRVLLGLLRQTKTEILDPILRDQFEKAKAAQPASPTTAPASPAPVSGKS